MTAEPRAPPEETPLAAVAARPEPVAAELAATSMEAAAPRTSGTGGSGGGSDTCHKLCDKGEALNCPMDTKGDCASQCAASPAKCSTQLSALAACAQTITYMCVDGEATPNGCDTEFGAYLGCLTQ